MRITFIYGNILHLTTYINDLLKLLQLYQQYYPEANTEINQLIEEIDLEYLQEDLPKLIHSLQVGSDRIQNIVLSLRNFSRLDESDCKLADIHSGIDSTLMILNHRLTAQPHRCAIAISKEYTDLPLIECYPGQLNQVFMNIFSNGLDCTETGELYAPELEQSPKALLLKTFIVKLSRNFSTIIGLKYKKFHSDDT